MRFQMTWMSVVQMNSYPIGSMYGIFTYIYHKNQLNVGEYTIHGSYRYGMSFHETFLKYGTF